MVCDNMYLGLAACSTLSFWPVSGRAITFKIEGEQTTLALFLFST